MLIRPLRRSRRRIRTSSLAGGKRDISGVYTGTGASARAVRAGRANWAELLKTNPNLATVISSSYDMGWSTCLWLLRTAALNIAV
jgi:hypothetical protein